MSITIPGGVYLPDILTRHDFQSLMAWFESNNIRPYAVTAERNVTIGDTIDRWEIVDDDPARPYPNGYARHSGYELQPGEEWTNDTDLGMAVRSASSPIVVPLPDDMRTTLETALKAASA